MKLSQTYLLVSDESHPGTPATHTVLSAQAIGSNFAATKNHRKRTSGLYVCVLVKEELPLFLLLNSKTSCIMMLGATPVIFKSVLRDVHEHQASSCKSSLTVGAHLQAVSVKEPSMIASKRALVLNTAGPPRPYQASHAHARTHTYTLRCTLHGPWTPVFTPSHKNGSFSYEILATA